MVVKSCLAALGSVVEALLIDATSPPLGRRQKYTSRVTHLVGEAVVPQPLADELLWLWDMRCRQHLFELTFTEFDFYSMDHLARAERTLRDFAERLRAAYGDRAASYVASSVKPMSKE